MSKTFTTTEVAEHKDAASGLYIIVDTSVYDVTCMPLPAHAALLKANPSSSIRGRASRGVEDPEAGRGQGRN
jgi:hypothetical protein